MDEEVAMEIDQDDETAVVVGVENLVVYDEVNDISNDSADSKSHSSDYDSDSSADSYDESTDSNSIFAASDSESEVDYGQIKAKAYVRALREFNQQMAALEAAIPVAVMSAPRSRAKFVSHNYEYLLYGLRRRSKNTPFGDVQGFDELETFCSAIRIGWRLRPDYWAGLLIMVEFLAKDTLTEDIKRIDLTFLLTVKEIASKELWSSAFGGAEMSSQAKRILIRYKKASSTPNDEEKVGHIDDNDKVQKVGGTMFGLQLRPEYEDHKVCGGVDCIEIELTPGEFPHCGRCKRAVYHSRKCQVKAWKAGHKKMCKIRQE